MQEQIAVQDWDDWDNSWSWDDGSWYDDGGWDDWNGMEWAVPRLSLPAGPL